MESNKIEKLVIYIVIALVLQIVTNTIVNMQMAPGGELNTVLFKISVWGKAITAPAVGLAIGYWLFTVNSQKKFLWACLGFLANWWALPVFVYYQYSNNRQGHNQ